MRVGSARAYTVTVGSDVKQKLLIVLPSQPILLRQPDHRLKIFVGGQQEQIIAQGNECINRVRIDQCSKNKDRVHAVPLG